MRNYSRIPINRRGFLRAVGGVVGAVAGSALFPGALLRPESVEYTVHAAAGESTLVNSQNLQAGTAVDKHLVATDGWVSLPASAVVPHGTTGATSFHPDNMAPDHLTTYIFGYRDVTGLSTDLTFAQKMKAQLSGPIFWLNEGEDFTLKLTNLGLQIRPDLIDAHTLHFHGFRNALPIFDGEPHSSVGVPIVRDLTYFFRPHHPGTYLYHCHFEETEHVHMGMVGAVYINPAQNGQAIQFAGREFTRFAYNDGDGSTGYDREYTITLNEVWAEAHWCDSHIQLPEWTDYSPEFYLMNGRVYPDTIVPNGEGTNPVTGDLIAPLDHNGQPRPDLQYQPISSLIRCKAGEHILLRIANIGFFEQSLAISGMKMRVVGHDAMLLRGRDGTDLSSMANTIAISTGESLDAIFTAPAYNGAGSEPDRYLLYNTNPARLTNAGYKGYGGQMTEIWVYPEAYDLPPQTVVNH